eukprot:4215354-Pleurochrysis_carterae.AAC.2
MHSVHAPFAARVFPPCVGQVAALAEGDTDVKLTKKQRDTAARLRTELRDFYPTFKDILGYGWTLGYAPCLEEAGKLILSTKKAKAA